MTQESNPYSECHIKPMKEYKDIDDFLHQTGFTLEEAYHYFVYRINKIRQEEAQQKNQQK